MQNPFDDPRFFFERVFPEDFPALPADTYLLIFADHAELDELKQSDFAVGCEDFLATVRSHTCYYRPCRWGTSKTLRPIWSFGNCTRQIHFNHL
jgi:hypothetical protein